MGYRLEMDEDGILKVTFIGDFSEEEAMTLYEEAKTYLAQASESAPLNALIDSRRSTGKMGMRARKILMQLNKDPHMGKAASIGANGFVKVLGIFIAKATGRSNMGFFDSEEEALAWLRKES